MDLQPSQELRQLIQKVSQGATLSEDEIRTALDQMTAGAATPAQMGAFLMALRVRGETVEEITGAAQMLRARMMRVPVPEDAVDIVGTGGDSHGTYNVSTCAALIAAGAGVKVAKHGNRRVSSMSGASDVLSTLGVKLDGAFETISRCVETAGVGFMWAPLHHPAMKHWAPIRGELGIRTIFNLLGPVSNPGGVKRQVVGVFSWHWVEPIAHVLNNLGAKHVWVVHGHDGLDELTTTGATDVAELKDGKVTVFEVTPADAVWPRPSCPISKAATSTPMPRQFARFWPARRRLSGISPSSMPPRRQWSRVRRSTFCKAPSSPSAPSNRAPRRGRSTS